MDVPFSFNRPIRIGSRRDRITGDSGALTGRELRGAAGWCGFWRSGCRTSGRAPDPAFSRRLARTLLLLAGQGRREHSDATELRDDPALRLATSDRAGAAPLGKAGRLPSQPTLSRRVAAWSEKEGVEVLREGLQRLAGWRLKAMGGWRRPKKLVIDIDSLPVEVHGEQPGSAWNATITGACIIRSWRRRGRRATSWTCGCARGRCTRGPGWSSPRGAERAERPVREGRRAL